MSVEAPERVTVQATAPRLRAWGVPAVGVLASGATLAVSEVAGALTTGAERPVIALGDLMVRHTPTGVREAVIGVFGTSDKPFLITCVVVVTLLLGTVLGRLAARNPLFGDAGVALLAAAATAAGLSSNGQPGPQVFVGVVTGTVGIVVLRLLVPSAVAVEVARGAVAGAGAGKKKALAKAEDRLAVERRDFLVRTSAIAALGGVALVASRAVRSSKAVAVVRAKLGLPAVTDPAPALPAMAEPFVLGIRPVVTPNADFYRVDVSLSTPQVDPATWTLQITGLVGAPVTLDYAMLQAMPQVERRITIGCIGNEVGGPQIGTALWQGVRLADVLTMAAPQATATQLVGVSVDGYTGAMPLSVALDGRDALLAIGMNGQPLPVEHGFPVRMITPGYYGYASAVKWISEIKLVDDSYQAFWVRRGYAKDAPFRTQSQIDVPRGRVSSGTVTAAGFAWAPHRGVSGVQVRVDGAGDWHDATLSPDLGADTWRGWTWDWPAQSGAHVLQVRATDGDGNVQDGTPTDVLPSGATGYHAVRVTVI